MLREQINQYLHLDKFDVNKLTVRDVVLFGVLSTSGVSLLLNLVDVGRLGYELAHWAEAWLMDFSTDIAGGGLTFLFFKWFTERREQADDQTEDFDPAATLDVHPRSTTYIIDAEEAPALDLPEPEAADAIEEEKQRLQRLADCVNDLRNAETPEARRVPLNLLVQDNLLIDIQLIDMNLQRAELNGADLSGADLTRSNLRGAKLKQAVLKNARLMMTQLIEADLRGADLSYATLERTFLSGADMAGAILIGTRIQASLWKVNLRNADLTGANLRGVELFRTDLRGADLNGVQLEGAKINSETLLPDGSHWDGKSDLSRFTNPSHPAFWRSGDPESPAYREIT